MDKKVGKKEILLLVIIFVAAVIGYFVFQKMQSTPGGQVKVTVDGSVYGTYDLHTTPSCACQIKSWWKWKTGKKPSLIPRQNSRTRERRKKKHFRK